MENLRWRLEHNWIDISEKTFNLIFDYIDDGYIQKNNITEIDIKDDHVLVSTNLGKKILIDKIYLERFKLQKIIDKINGS